MSSAWLASFVALVTWSACKWQPTHDAFFQTAAPTNLAEQIWPAEWVASLFVVVQNECNHAHVSMIHEQDHIGRKSHQHQAWPRTPKKQIRLHAHRYYLTCHISQVPAIINSARQVSWSRTFHTWTVLYSFRHASKRHFRGREQTWWKPK